MFLEVLDQLVFPAEFVVVAEVVNFLVGGQFALVEFVDELLLAPDHVPLLALHSLPPSQLERLQDAVAKIGAESHGGTAYMGWYICGCRSRCMSCAK
jgi:hypothetical protein